MPRLTCWSCCRHAPSLPCLRCPRIALVAAFLVSPFGAAERTWKPFNPVLGETFEADKLQNDAFFVAEQVGTHQCWGVTWLVPLVRCPVGQHECRHQWFRSKFRSRFTGGLY